MTWRLVIPILLMAPVGCHNVLKPAGTTEKELALQEAAAVVLKALTPDEVNVENLKKTELANAPVLVLKAIDIADRLSREGIGYRKDSRKNPLTPEQIINPPDELSCTEFVWLVYSRAGLKLGNFHIETKEMAYDRGVYAPLLSKHKPSEAVRPGDILVYEYSDELLIRQEEQTGRYHAGHAVLVVSVEQKIVVGSNGNESTPPATPIGVGYRKILGSWNEWTAGRRLKAIYRLSNWE